MADESDRTSSGDNEGRPTLDEVITRLHLLAMSARGDDQQVLYAARQYLSVYEGARRNTALENREDMTTKQKIREAAQ